MTDLEIIEVIKMEGTATRGLIRSEIDRIDEMNELRNGRIDKNKDDLYQLNKETRLSRFAQRNAGKMIIGFIIIVAIISLGAHSINVKRTIEKAMRIELKE